MNMMAMVVMVEVVRDSFPGEITPGRCCFKFFTIRERCYSQAHWQMEAFGSRERCYYLLTTQRHQVAKLWLACDCIKPSLLLVFG